MEWQLVKHPATESHTRIIHRVTSCPSTVSPSIRRRFFFTPSVLNALIRNLKYRSVVQMFALIVRLLVSVQPAGEVPAGNRQSKSHRQRLAKSIYPNFLHTSNRPARLNHRKRRNLSGRICPQASNVASNATASVCCSKGKNSVF